MKKIRLGIDELGVESFATAAPRDLRGTVDARGGTALCTPRCGTARAGETCYSGCTAEVCEPTWDC